MRMSAFVLLCLFISPASAIDSVSDVKLEFGRMFSKYQQKYGNKYLSDGNTINSEKSKSSADEFYAFYDEAVSLMKRYSATANKTMTEEKFQTSGGWNVRTFKVGGPTDDDEVSLRISAHPFELEFQVRISDQDKKNYDFGDQNIEGECFDSEGFFVEFSGCETVDELENKKCKDGNFLIHRMLYTCPVVM